MDGQGGRRGREAKGQNGGARKGREALKLIGGKQDQGETQSQVPTQAQCQSPIQSQSQAQRTTILSVTRVGHVSQARFKLLLLHHNLNLTKPPEMKIGLGTRFQPNKESHGKCS
ncbi:hypothetical protein ACFX1S_032612 [Malus domestica]